MNSLSWGCVGDSALATALYRSISTDMCWNRKALSHLASVIRVMCLPRSMPSLFMAPVVLVSIGTNEHNCVSGPYLAIFLFAAAPDLYDDSSCSLCKYYYYYYYYYNHNQDKAACSVINPGSLLQSDELLCAM